MAFPKLPFTLDKNNVDADLVSYLQESDHFSFIQADTRNLLKSLKKEDLRSQNMHLLKIWPSVLTDALKTLKKNDPREWDIRNKVSPASFFHKASLGVDELEKVLESFSDFEGMLYGASPNRYRDHIAHVFRVWLIGHAILVEPKCMNNKLYASKLFEGMINSEEWQCMWAIASLCHDLGYPLSYIDKINTLARKALQGMGFVHGGDLRFSFSQHMMPFNDTIVRLISSDPVHIAPTPIQSMPKETEHNDKPSVVTDVREYTTHLQNKYYLKFLKSLDSLSHGIVSAILLSRSLVYLLESDLARDTARFMKMEDARQFLIRREILRSIASHTCRDIYHLQFNTLSFLLYIVDEIQCWGRPTLEELQLGIPNISEGTAIINAFEPHKIDIVIKIAEKWDEKQKVQARRQLDKLHRILRLAVGTQKLAAHNNYLNFTVLSQDGNGVHLLLEKGRITLDKIKSGST